MGEDLRLKVCDGELATHAIEIVQFVLPSRRRDGVANVYTSRP